jgi:hypothetical protein
MEHHQGPEGSIAVAAVSRPSGVGPAADRTFAMGPIDWRADAPCYEVRCLDRLTVANTMSSVNTALRNSGGTSIMVWRLGRAPAEDEECNRRNGAASAVDSEDIQSLSLRALQPSGRQF